MDQAKPANSIVIPEEIFTARLCLRAPRASDSNAMSEAINESLAELAPWMPWAKRHSPADSENFLTGARAKFLAREDFMFVIERLSDRCLVGGAGLHRFDWSVPRFEIGYWVRTSLCGQGYATEATAGLVTLCFEQLGARRIEVHVDPRNVRSWHVPERLGFALEGVLRNHKRDSSGKLRDTRVYSVVRSD